MTRHEPRALRLEPFEDRLVPSQLSADPVPFRAPDAAVRADVAERLAAGAVAHDFAAAWAAAGYPLPADVDDHVSGRSDGARAAVVVADLSDALAAAAVAQGAPTRAVRTADVSVPATALGVAQPPSVAVPAPTGPATPGANAAPPPAEAVRSADGPVAVSGAALVSADVGPVGLTFHGGVAVPDASADVIAPTPVAPEPAPTEAPSPREVVDRVIEAIFPAGVPLAGAVAVDTAAVTAAVAVLDRLPGFAADAADGWESPERWTWVAAGVLVAGGAAVAARGTRGRDRSAAAAPGTESALARWEDRCANELD